VVNLLMEPTSPARFARTLSPRKRAERVAFRLHGPDIGASVPHKI
jgi:hypothetical protein